MRTKLPSVKGHSPQLSAHVCCGQPAGWIKMPLGREVGLGPGDIVLDGDPSPFPTDNAFSAGKKTPSRRSTMRPIVNMPKEDRATDIGNMYKQMEKIAPVVPEISSRTDRQTDLNSLPMYVVAKRLDGSCHLAWR